MSAARATKSPPPARLPFLETRWAVWLAAALIVLAGFIVYRDSFSGPFVLDDLPAISENPTIHHLWPIWEPLLPPPNGQTVTGRPLVNLTLAANYALGGLNVWGYHAFNVAIHLLAALALFGVARRTFLRPVLRPHFGSSALPLAFFIALLWVVHPLATESVTYLIQRAEALMALFYLLTLYAFIRGIDSPRPWRLWYPLSIAACLLGMACKEVMVSAPLIVLLYDRTFVAGNFRDAWRQRRRLYCALAATWLLLLGLVANAGTRGDSAGFGAGVAWFPYALTQFGAISHYLWLSLWPSPLILDYGHDLASGAAQILPYALFISLLVAGTIYALFRRPVLGFFGAAFFAILAPSSSVVPVVTQTVAEHRMYLPLTILIALAVASLFQLLGRRAFLLYVVLALLYGDLTFQRNADYQTAVSIWADTVAKLPNSARAHENLAIALVAAGQSIDGIGHYYRALQLQPDYPEAHTNLGNALAAVGRTDEAIENFRAAIQRIPTLTAAHYNLANTLAGAGRYPEAIAEYRIVLQLDPNFAPAHNNFGNVLNSTGRLREAQAQYELAVQLDPSYAAAQYNLGNVFIHQHQLDDARVHYAEAIRLNPDYAEAHNGLANALVLLGRPDEAIPEYETALRLKPGFSDALTNLAFARQQAAAVPANP
ncbi:MAG: tetratricopeptide repeat protein [Opitutales bacterium]|jgi:tetratricopeptide (TPR) repeat protein